MSPTHLACSGLLLTLLLGACNRQEPPPVATETVSASSTTPSSATSEPAAPPPGPPIRETFDLEPQLSLFPRTGTVRPEDDNSEGLGYWNAFIDHIMRTSGATARDDTDKGRAWIIKGIKGLDSIAFFSPLAVKPSTAYRVSFDFKGEIPKGGKAGVGVLEFDQFLWIGEQFSQSLLNKHQTGSVPGISLTGKQPWSNHSFTFTTSPRTAMIHLVLFRDGEMDREKPVWFDNITIEEASAKQP